MQPVLHTPAMEARWPRIMYLGKRVLLRGDTNERAVSKPGLLSESHGELLLKYRLLGPTPDLLSQNPSKWGSAMLMYLKTKGTSKYIWIVSRA